MRVIGFAAIIIVLSLFESSVYPAPLVLYFLIGLTVISWRRILELSFVSGVILDFLTGRVLGADSLFFLTAVSLVILYRRKIHPEIPYYLIPYTILASLFYRFIFWGSFDINWFIISIVLSIIVYAVIFSNSDRLVPRQTLQL